MELHAQLACRLPDKVEIIQVGPMAELVYYRCCLRCREYLTDGVIAREHISRWFAGISHASKHLNRLSDAGLLEICEVGWRFPDRVWREWIPTRESVDAKRAAEAERIREYRQRKRAEREAYGDRTDVQDTYVRDVYGERTGQPEPLATSHEPLATSHPKSSLDGYASRAARKGIETTLTDLSERFRA